MTRALGGLGLAIALVGCTSSTGGVVPGGAGSVGVTPVSDSGIVVCSVPLATTCALAGPGDSCPPSGLGTLPASWCAEHPNLSAATGPCDGYLFLVQQGFDDSMTYVFDATSGALVALLTRNGGGNELCLGGPASFALSDSCFNDGTAYQGDAGLQCAPADAGVEAGSTGAADASADGD